ncbi:DUF4276 family protein [Streptomonospora nanhaiensis]|uniref:DUF4276 family protein n=1 Tax=Streptomonospora nanhaiensis TaxID=1323731 RepID=A0ABY6YTC8_9ACTN|nr:DUF4276 family protein [Streptomonospora nanhaiensis]WAE75505.1 DUF4276 family protein [Streptomonospora nanhaiensis]
MPQVTIAPIVEGHGEMPVVRSLIDRISRGPISTYVEVTQPLRLAPAKMRKLEELAKAIRFQSARVRDRGGVLVLRDGDGSDITCPVELAASFAPEPDLVTVPVEIVIARHEYEAWFLAAAESLRSHPSVHDDAQAPEDPEGKRDAKTQLRGIMNESDKKTLHQAKFTAVMDLNLAVERSRSFRRMVNAIRSLSG